MERNEILKSIGFSDNFLTALNDYDNKVSNDYFEIPVFETETEFNLFDSAGELIIDLPNDNYNNDLIIFSK